MGRWSALVVFGCTTVGAALFVACSYTDDGDPPEAPLIIEPAPAKAGPPLNLEIPLDPSGLFEFSQWPPACDLLTDDEITVVLPQATVTEHEADDQEFRFVDTLQTVTVADSACTYVLDIPEAGLSVATFVRVKVDAAGSPEVVEWNAHPGRGDPRIEVTSGECWGFENSTTVSCRKGSLAFTLSSNLDNQQAGRDSWTNRYEVAGETTTFTGGYGNEGGEATAENDEFLRDALSAELAKIILAKI